MKNKENNQTWDGSRVRTHMGSVGVVSGGSIQVSNCSECRLDYSSILSLTVLQAGVHIHTHSHFSPPMLVSSISYSCLSPAFFFVISSFHFTCLSCLSTLACVTSAFCVIFCHRLCLLSSYAHLVILHRHTSSPSSLMPLRMSL